MATLFKDFGSKLKKTLVEQSKKRREQLNKELQKRKELRIKKRQKFTIIKQMTNPELLKVVKNFISVNPQVQDVNAKGEAIKRKPTRVEMEDAILKRVPLKSVFFLIPRLDPKRPKRVSQKKPTKKKKFKVKPKKKPSPLGKGFRVLFE